VEYPDRRIKPVVYTMVSSGTRIGAWDYLRWKDVVPIEDKDGKVLAAKLIVYAGDPEEYYSFLTPEAYYALKDWMDFRSEICKFIHQGCINNILTKTMTKRHRLPKVKESKDEVLDLVDMGNRNRTTVVRSKPDPELHNNDPLGEEEDE
jgi:hypothetical protein